MRRRRERVAAAINEKGLDCLIIWGAVSFGMSTGQINTAYLSNYAGVIQNYIVFPKDQEPTLLITTPRHLTNARMFTTIEDIRAHDDEMAEGIVARLRELKLDTGRIGIVGAHPGEYIKSIPRDHFKTIRSAFPNATFENVSNWYDSLLLVKSEEELGVLRRAARIGDGIYQDILDATRDGVTNAALRRVLHVRCAQKGVNYCFGHVGSFEMANPHDDYPDFYSVERPARRGDVLMTETCVGIGAYWNKIWGSWFIGEPTPEYARMYDFAVQLQEKVLGALKPGSVGKDFDRFAQEVVQQGYDLRFPLIHGWCATNSDPRVGTVPDTPMARKFARFQDWRFEQGHTLTVVAWIGIPGTKKAVWVGSSGAVVEDGFDNFNDATYRNLHIR